MPVLLLGVTRPGCAPPTPPPQLWARHPHPYPSLLLVLPPPSLGGSSSEQTSLHWVLSASRPRGKGSAFPPKPPAKRAGSLRASCTWVCTSHGAGAVGEASGSRQLLQEARETLSWLQPGSLLLREARRRERAREAPAHLGRKPLGGGGAGALSPNPRPHRRQYFYNTVLARPL